MSPLWLRRRRQRDMFIAMTRTSLLTTFASVGLSVATLFSHSAAAAPAKKPAPVVAPKVGDVLPFPALKTWLVGAPNTDDASGKVVLHWFCGPKIKACTDDLASVISLRDMQKLYVVAYINGSQRDAKKFDPIHDDVGAGAVSYGPEDAKLTKAFNFGAQPGAVVVDVDGKVAYVDGSGDPAAIDARNSKIKALVAAIKDFSATPTGADKMKVGERFDLNLDIELSSWLKFSKSEAPSVTLTVPSTIKCDKTTLAESDLKVNGQSMIATFSCTATKAGSYEVQALYRFSYDQSSGGTGIGTDAVKWKFAAGM